MPTLPHGIRTTPRTHWRIPQLARHQQGPRCIRPMALQDEDDGESSSEVAGNEIAQEGQAGSFGEYLIPYALAVGGSLLATALFVKFVLLDN